MECVINHYLTDLEKDSSDIVVIGSNIPEELVLVSGKMPYWILGGSRVSFMWADDMVPRDTDPASRSGLGYVLSGFAEQSLILIPLVSDNTRKLAYTLKPKGLRVHTFHFPPVKDDQTFLEWRRQYEACRDVVSLHLKRPLTKWVLQKSQEQILMARKQMQYFMEVSQDTLDGTGRMFFKRFNLFKLKKDCTSCTECGACYHACPMRIKSIYTEREKENVQTVDCMMCGECINKCPEDNALSMTLCGKAIYKSSRKTFMSKFSGKKCEEIF